MSVPAVLTTTIISYGVWGAIGVFNAQAGIKILSATGEIFSNGCGMLFDEVRVILGVERDYLETREDRFDKMHLAFISIFVDPNKTDEYGHILEDKRTTFRKVMASPSIQLLFASASIPLAGKIVGGCPTVFNSCLKVLNVQWTNGPLVNYSAKVIQVVSRYF